MINVCIPNIMHPTKFSLSLSDWHPRALDITMGVLQTGSWLGGIWGLYILLGMVGNTLDSTQWGIRQRLVATLAFVIWIITILDQVLQTHHQNCLSSKKYSSSCFCTWTLYPASTRECCQNSTWSCLLKAASFSSSVSHWLDISMCSTTGTGVFVIIYMSLYVPTTRTVSRLMRTTSRASCPRTASSPSSTKREINLSQSDPFLVHCCTLTLCYLGAETDDHHRNPNINTEIILLGN